MTNNLPKVLYFTDLHLTKNLKAAKKALSEGRAAPLWGAGVYAIICNVTGAIYIGSSINIGNRLVYHLVTNNTNDHLQNAITKYGGVGVRGRFSPPHPYPLIIFLLCSGVL
jgi:hypothetical protein